MSKNTVTVEQVRRGHPDKICDQIADAILDAYLEQDPYSRVAIEVFGTAGKIFLGGEVSTQASVGPEDIALAIYGEIGHADQPEVITNIVSQSPEIAQGVDSGGAGDQGIMYGFATSQTAEMLPQEVVWARRLVELLDGREIKEKLPWLLPDGKVQVTTRNNKVKTLVISVQHDPKASLQDVRSGIKRHVVGPIFGSPPIRLLVNPTGSFSKGGFGVDSGLTGRKIIADTYGGLAPHGGGSFSGKDPTKVDRSAAYFARWTARRLVKQELGEEITVAVSYAIGIANPVMLKAWNEKGDDLSGRLADFNFRPAKMIEDLKLRRPIYLQTSYHGHFGRNTFPWEED